MAYDKLSINILSLQSLTLCVLLFCLHRERLKLTDVAAVVADAELLTRAELRGIASAAPVRRIAAAIVELDALVHKPHGPITHQKMAAPFVSTRTVRPDMRHNGLFPAETRRGFPRNCAGRRQAV